MTLLNPSALFGLLALLLPIIIHLFNFRRRKKVYFSNTQFLKEAQQVSRNRQKLKHLLVLISRLLMITFVVLAFAQPFIPATGVKQLSAKVMVYIDNSQSMAIESVNGGTLLEEAKNKGLLLAENYPPDTQFKLITNDFDVQSHRYLSKDIFIQALSNIQLSPVVRSWNDLMERVSNDHESIFYFFSDFQKSTIGEIAAGDNSLRLQLVPLRAFDLSNIYIDSFFLQSPVVLPGQPLQLEVVLTNTGDKNETDLPLNFYLEDQLVWSGTFDLAAQSTTQQSISFVPTLKAHNKGVLMLDDYPNTFDNEQYLVINRLKPIKIYEVTGEGVSQSLEDIYANDSLFTFQQSTVGNLDYEGLMQKDLLILNQVGSPSEVLLSYLQNYVKAGGTLFIIPGNTNPNVYQKIWPLPLAAGDTLTQTLAQPNLNQPFFEGVFQENKAFSMPSDRSVLSWPSSAYDILRFQNGRPFLSTDTQSKIYLLANRLEPIPSSFSRHALFVPVMLNMAFRTQVQLKTPLAFTIEGGVYTIPLESEKYKVFSLEKEGTRLIPDQNVSGDELLMSFTKDILQPGIYQIYGDQTKLGMLAVNTNQKESDLAPYISDELATLIAKNVEIWDAADFATRLPEQLNGRHLWRYCLVLSLCFLILEIVFIRFLK